MFHSLGCRLTGAQASSLAMSAKREPKRATETVALQSVSLRCFVRVSSCDFVDRPLYAAKRMIHEITRTNKKPGNA
jgi:hypothetical protein